MDWGKPSGKTNPIQNIEKTVKIKTKLPHVNKKITSEKANFCSNTTFHSTLKLERKIPRHTTTRFSLHFLFRDQNHNFYEL